MVTAIDLLREQLMDRRQRLEVAVGAFHEAPNLSRLLEEVDTALARMDDGTHGLCDLRHEHHDQSPRSLVDNCVRELNHFCSGRARADDLTIMALRRAA